MFVDFLSLPWSQPARQQFSKLFGNAIRDMKVARASSKFIQLFTENAYDVARGIYVPLSHTLELKGKLPIISKRLASQDGPLMEDLQFFTNALVIPEGYEEPGFNPKGALTPTNRLANAGLLVVAHEFDCGTLDQFEEMLSWTRGGGGVFRRSKFGDVDRELGRFKEYAGYNITYSGRRSLHFHLVFSTKHIAAAPFDADADARRAACVETAALMGNVHEAYWHHVWGVIQDKLRPSFAPDESMGSPVQWRRMPWAVRELDKDAPTLGLEAGMRVPQLSVVR